MAEYKTTPIEDVSLSGTDIYLSFVSSFVTIELMYIMIKIVSLVHNITLAGNICYSLMAIAGLLACHHTLTNRNQRFFRLRVFNAVTFAINLVLISPFTVPCQIAQSVTNGFSITRNLFD